MTGPQPPRFDREQQILGLILILAAINALLFVFLMPPWQHYDEPNHFEYLWLTANLDHLPTPADYSSKLNRQVLKSMIEHGFYNKQSPPVVGPPSEKVSIPGYSQLTDPPFYYLVASLPLHLIPNRGVNAQLYAARLVSMLFFLFTVLAGYGVASELAPKGRPLRWMLPLSIALLPSFADLMTAVNNDVAAIALSSVFLFISVRLIRRGFSLIDFLSLCLVSGLIVLSEITAAAWFITLPFTLLFSIFRSRLRGVAWGASLVILIAAVAVSLRWDDAFAWYRNTSQSTPTRMRSEQAPLGDFALMLDTSAKATPRSFPPIYQNMPVQKARAFEGKQVTYGYWIWAETAATINAPLTLRAPGAAFSDTLEVTRSPTFHAWSVTIPTGANRLWIDLNPNPLPQSNRIFYDGLVLVEGEYPTSEPPVFSGPDGRAGAWGGRPFENTLINPSAETAGPRASPLVDDFGASILPDSTRPSLVLASLVDLQGARNLYPPTARHLFQTFWARFGWGHVAILGGNATYLTLFIFSMVLLVFALLRGFRLRQQAPWDVVFVLGLVTVLSTLVALTRAVVYLAVPGFYIATARYFYPVVIPLMLLFSAGWLELSFWLSRLSSRFRLTTHEAQETPAASTTLPFPHSQFYLFFGFFVVISLLSFASILHYYY